jgi:four helix bundle protein
LSSNAFNSYRDLVVWQAAMALAEECYRLTRSFPREEMFGLTSQVRRAAASIPANVAEGHGRESTGSFIHSLRIAQGSTKELETHLLLSERVGLLTRETLDPAMARCTEIGKMLRSLIRSLQEKGE